MTVRFEIGEPGDDRKRRVHFHEGEPAYVCTAVDLTVPELADLRRLLAEQVDEYTGRRLIATGYGDDVRGIEATAIVQAQEFFGDVELFADPHYTVELIRPYHRGRSEAIRDTGAKFCAEVTVRERMSAERQRRQAEILAQFAPPQPSDAQH